MSSRLFHMDGVRMSLGVDPQDQVSSEALVDAVPVASTKEHGKSPSRIAFDRLRKDRMAFVCGCVVVFFILVAVLAPLLCAIEGQNYSDFHTELVDEFGFPTIGPNADHWFGVEPKTGRDLFAQWTYGARPSLVIAFVAAITSSVVGVVLGLTAGFLSGWVDRVISWVIDFVLIGVLVFFGWASLARLIRGEVISLREREFVAAAKVIGVPTRRVLFKELLPNLVA